MNTEDSYEMERDTTEELLVGRPNLGNHDIFLSKTEEILKRRWLTNNGRNVQDLEKKLCSYLGVRHCIPVCNATVGLQLCVHAFGLTGEVVTTPYTFVATAHALQWEGIRPVFADIELSTHNLDPQAVEAAITAHTTAILGVHVWGRPCVPEALQEIADRHKIPLMFDAAHAFGCSHNGRMIGNFGNCEVFSFHATKFFNTFEGGAIATNDDDLAAKIRLMKNFGFSGMDNVVHLGTNAKMSEIHAAMGLACYDVIDNILTTNKAHYNHYRKRLSSLPGIRFCNYDDVEKSNYQYIVIEIDNDDCAIGRDSLMNHLHASGVMARRYFYPGCHNMEPYMSLYSDKQKKVPMTDKLTSRTLILPTGTALTADDVDRVCDCIEAAII
ncbi:MAG: DegT/DnrJ/EryC1/StrS family aminotransferase [Akkermansiaceae bacterium]